ncbi:hypothetical protein BDZ89DRAFT_1047716 [Hymenopellis radicata]|nr:hypothetical protein BDZ89DRAFT_1047716 [Hymenopellis radicata]
MVPVGTPPEPTRMAHGTGTVTRMPCRMDRTYGTSNWEGSLISSVVSGAKKKGKASKEANKRFNHNFVACNPIWCKPTANSFAIRHKGGNYPIGTCPPLGGPKNFLFERGDPENAGSDAISICAGQSAH